MYTIVTEQPLSGPQWAYLSEVLERVGLHPDDARLRPIFERLAAAPGTRQINEVRDEVAAELFSLNQPVLLMGNTPLRVLTGTGGVTKKRGLLPSDTIDAYVTLSPGAVMAVPNHRHEWVKDLAAFQQLVNPPKENVQVHVVEDWDSYEKFLDACDYRGAVDIETTITESPWLEMPVLVSVAVTFDGANAFIFRDDEWLEKAAPTLEAQEWIMHNGLFDRLMMRRWGINLTLKHDTMAMAYLLHEEDRKGLEILSSVYLGLPPYKGVDYENILDEPFEKVARMNAVDACRTFNLFRPLADKLNENKDLSRLYQWILMPAVNTLIRVTENGIPVDKDNLASLAEVILAKQAETTEALRDMAPEPDEDEYPKGWPKKDKERKFNPASFKQVGHILYDLWGLPVHKETDSGNASTDEDTLTTLQVDLDETSVAGKFVDTLLLNRTVNKQASSYINAWPNHISDDGRMHPRYKPLHVVTGRLSSELPNIQQVPNIKEFRDVFGGVGTWLKADYSQIELRLAAWAADEDTMLAAFREGEDLHRLTAELVLQDRSDKARKVGKVLNFGLLYGAGANTLRRIARMDYGLQLSQREAKAYRDKFFMAYPKLLEWHRDMERSIKETGKAVSALGRVRHLPAAQSWDDSEAMRAVRMGINHPIQSFASDILLKSLSRVQAQLDTGSYEAEVIAEVHDEMDLLVYRDVDAVAEMVQTTMEDVEWVKKWGINLTVPIVADIETGTHWGSLTEWSKT